jgi:hypothetical protein
LLEKWYIIDLQGGTIMVCQSQREGRFHKWLKDAHDWAVSRNRFPYPFGPMTICPKWFVLVVLNNYNKKRVWQILPTYIVNRLII